MQELREPQPGRFLIAQHLASMMLVQALRLHLPEGLHGGVGWLFALADKQMSAAITSMHDNRAHRWTLQELAERASMSRSTFALKFKEMAGTSPMEYLARWRMLLAGDKLVNSSDSISPHRPVARLRIRKPLQHSLQEGHGLFATATQPCRIPASPFLSEGKAAHANHPEPVAV
jgi:AraC-like DNA-binding protein